MTLNFPNTGLYPGYQYTGDNGVIYIYDGVKWVGHAPNTTPGTNSITNGSNTVQVDGSGNLVTPAYTFPGNVGTDGQVLTWPSSGSTLEWHDQQGGGGNGYTGSQGSSGTNGYTGSQGDPGSTWLSSTGLAPRPGNNPNDQYLDNDTGNIYQWDGETWIFTGNIKGPVGPQGDRAQEDRLVNGLNEVVLGPDGTLTVPGEVVNKNDFVITAGTSPAIANVVTSGADSNLTHWQLFVSSDVYPTLGTDVQVGATVYIPWRSITVNVIEINQDVGGHRWVFVVDQNVILGYSGGASVSFGPGQASWTFGTDGVLTLPATPNGGGGGVVIFPSATTGTQAMIDYGSDRQGGAFELTNTDGTNRIYMGLNLDGNQINLAVGNVQTDEYKNWYFNADGNLTLPNGSTIGSADAVVGVPITTTRGTILLGNQAECLGGENHFHIMKAGQQEIDLFLGDDNNYVKLPSTGGVEISSSEIGAQYYWTFGADGKLTLPAADSQSISVIQSIGSIQIIANNKYWSFASDGNLTIPENGDILDSNGTSVLGGGGGGTPALHSLTDVDINLPLDGQALLWNNTSERWQNQSLSTVWTNDANGCLRVELSSTGFQAFTDGTHLDLRDDGIWNVGSYQNNTSIGNDAFANARDLSLRAGDTLFINTNIDTDGYDNQWMFGNNVLQTNGKAKIDFWKDTARLGAPAPNGTTDTLTLWNFNGENTIGEFYNYAIGVEGDHIWFAQDTDPTTNTGGFKFYSRGQEVFKIGANGDLMNNNGFTLNAGPRGTITLGKFIEVPGVDEHFHIAFPDSNLDIPYQDLFLGDDLNFVKVRGSHNGQALGVDIGANDRDGGGQKTWRFGTDGTIKFPDNTLANAPNSQLDITSEGYISIYSDENVSLNYVRTNLGPGPYAPGTLFDSGFSAGQTGISENNLGPFMYTVFTPDGVDIEEISAWSIDNSGNLQTIIQHYDSAKQEHSQRTGDIVDQFGNSIIHPVAGDTPPEGATDGRLWFKSDEARLYIMYGSQWIDASPTVIPPPPDAPGELVNGDATVSLQPDGSLLFPNGTGIGNLQHAWGGSANGIDIKSYNNVNGYSQLNWNDRSFVWTDSQGVGLQTHDADGVLIGQVRLNNLGFLETFAGDGDPMYIGQVGDNDSVIWAPDSDEGYLGLWMGGDRDLAGVGSTANYGPAVSVNVGKPLEDGEYASDPNTPDGYLVQVNVRGANWYFREDGGLQFPDGSVQTTAVVDGGNAYSALIPI